ncbi:MAG: RnfABCDGE type electron transport complex subunit G [Oscillospiraceae bacterium]|nr:RnfABCDGE type electron transport complex subunit G [Oscillospiraceae bacterium]MBQ7802107.1 RnfABCDGE type electron transport complex subunit G [Oscillospiraceae bacterium]
MKKESTFAYVLRLTVTLLLITAITAGALAWINSITEDRIAAEKARKTAEALSAVLPGGGEEVDIPAVDVGVPVNRLYKGENGYAVEVAPSGFGGTITMMVGVDLEGNILGVSVVSHTETAGLGAVAGDKTSKGEAFRGQYVGQSGELAVSKDGGVIDSISGATITSRAVTDGVNAALALVANMG